MTNAEAIETLRANYPDACYEQLRDAVDTAIEALKSQGATGDNWICEAVDRQKKLLKIADDRIDQLFRDGKHKLKYEYEDSLLNRVHAVDREGLSMDDLISRQMAIAAADRVDYTKLAIEDVKAVTDQVVKELKKLPSAERHEQITSEMDEIFRIASEIRLAVGCNTSRECWELARKGDIQRVRHGRWMHGKEIAREMVGDAIISIFYEDWHCSECKYTVKEREPLWKFCPNCGADMRGEQDDSISD